MIQPAMAHTKPVQSISAPVTAKQMRVLVVDDDPIYRETSRMFLNMYGRHVTVAENGKAGLAQAADTHFDIMIVDMEMPDMNGLEVIAKIRTMPHLADMPIIMVTSRDDAMAIDRAFELGAASFVVKPVNWTLLDHYLRFVFRAAQNEAMARQAQGVAEAAARTKDNLLSVLRHEMKTPLNAIVGFTKLAAEARTSGNLDGMRDHLDDVIESGQRLLTSFADMTVYSDLISQRIALNREVLSPDWLIDDALDANASLMAASSIKVSRDNRCADVKINGDSAMLASAVTRILDNALRHARDARHIVIRTDTTLTGDVVICVEDDGEGMDQASVSTCLEPLSQADMSLSRAHQGLGLGLPISHAVLSAHGGHLEIVTSPGKGMQVSLRMLRFQE